MTDEEKAKESLKKRKGEYWCIKTDNVYTPYTEGYKDGLVEGRKEICKKILDEIKAHEGIEQMTKFYIGEIVQNLGVEI